MTRLFMQLGYDLPVQRQGAKALVFVSSLSLLLIFMYYESDLTARMTSEPPTLNIRSFQDVIDQEYKVITYGGSLGADKFLINSPEGSPMREVSILSILKQLKVLKSQALMHTCAVSTYSNYI